MNTALPCLTCAIALPLAFNHANAQCDPTLGSVLRSGFVEPGVDVIHTFLGEAAGDTFGWVSGVIGDQDGDGLPDLLITAHTNDAGGNNAGRVYVFSSAPSVDPSVPIRVLTGTVANSQFGFNATDAGDHDGDGVSDILVSAPFTTRGTVYLFSGASGQLIAQFVGGSPGDQFGIAVRAGLDHNGDGVQEILVGAPAASPGGLVGAGAVRVFDGASRALMFTIPGQAAGDQFGTSTAPIPDQNGDAVPDILVGAPNAGTGTRGRMYLFSGADQALLCTAEPGGQGVALGNFFISSPGDVNNNGRADIHVTDFAHNGGRGRFYIFEFDGATCNLLFQVTGGPGDGLGIGNGTAGDLNFDHHADIVSGAWTSSDGAPLAGQVQLFSGADASVMRTITSTTAGENFGYDAHTVGDITGDCVDDMLVTAANFNATQGRAFLIAGVRAGPPCPADIAKPLGTLNLDDVGLFVAQFLGGGLLADLDASGTLNLDDVDAFAASFIAGCG